MTDRSSLAPADTFGSPERLAAERLIRLGLAEDLDQLGDVTSNLLIGADSQGKVAIVARSPGIVCGLPIAQMVLQAVDQRCEISRRVVDGTVVESGQTVGQVSGPLRSLLTAERTILNFLTHLSGVATLARQYTQAIAGTTAQILDTRKTHPGYRLLEKYAVRCGGATNHRIGLYDGLMVKDNHLAARRAAFPNEPATQFIEQLRTAWPQLPLTVEVDTLQQLEQLVVGHPDIVLLDNMSNEELIQAVAIRNRLAPTVLLEASGGVNLDTVTEIAKTGVDRISVGAITHSAPAFDLGFDWIS